VWGIAGKNIYLLEVFREKLNYPDLKRAVKRLAQTHHANVVLIEDRASGTQLIQELIAEGLHIVKRVKPEGDKKMRFNAQTATVENGFVHLPDEAPWRAAYLHELTTFPSSKYDDQADSTSQALAFINLMRREPNALAWARREYARTLHAQRYPLEEIAKMVDLTVEEINEYLESRARSKRKWEQRAAAIERNSSWR
jgi:predicted phage terminase large subunit-like protein